jgi:hypothetical protein
MTTVPVRPKDVSVTRATLTDSHIIPCDGADGVGKITYAALRDQMVGGLTGGLSFKGTVAGISVPDTSTAAGDYYVITSAGASQGKTWNVGDQAIYRGTSGQWDQIKTARLVSVRDYGAVGNGIVNDHAAIQAALNAAAGAVVYFPRGIYVINAALTVASNTVCVILGDGKELSCIRGSGAHNLLEVGTLGAQAERFEIRGLKFDGSNQAPYGIYSPNIDHCVIEGVRVMQTATAAIYISYGWNNSIRNSEISYNVRDGIRLGVVGGSGGNNAVAIDNTKIFLNGGKGADIQSGYGITFSEVTFEDNGEAGLFMRYGANCVNVTHCYFESNCSTGVAFTTPAETVKCDIVVNGMTNTDLQGRDFPCDSLLIDSCFYSGSQSNAFVRLNAARGVTIANCRSNDAPVKPLVEVMANSDYGIAENVRLYNNVGFTGDQPVLKQTTQYKTAQLSTWNIDGIVGRNYLTLDPYSFVGTGSNMVLARGDLAYNGFDTMKLTGTAGGDTDYAVVQLDLADYPELASKTVYVGAWVKNSANTMNVSAYISGIGESVDFTINNTGWRWVEMQRTLPSNGVISFGFRRLGGASNEAIYISKPVLSLVGISRDRYWRDSVPTVYRHTAAPTIGTWKAGQFVWNKAPAEGAPMGWVNAADGTPGTWHPLSVIPGTDGAVTIARTQTSAWTALMLQNGSNNAAATARLGLKVQSGAFGLLVEQVANAAGPAWATGPYDARLFLSQDNSYLHLGGAGGVSKISTAGALLTPKVTFSALPPVYANNAAAIAGGLIAGDIYRTGGDPDTICVVH